MKEKKTPLDIVSERFTTILSNGYKPWATTGANPVFKGANLNAYLKDESVYLGSMNPWLTSSLPFLNEKLYEELSEKLKSHACASAIMSKLVPKSILDELDINRKGVKPIGMIYSPGSFAGWYDPKGRLFCKVENGVERYKPTDIEVDKMSLKKRPPGKARFNVMYSAAQFFDQLPDKYVMPIIDKVGELEKPISIHQDLRDIIVDMTERAGFKFKVLGGSEGVSGTYSQAFESVVMPGMHQYENPHEWFYESFICIIEGEIQRKWDQIIKDGLKPEDFNPLFRTLSDKDGENVDFPLSVRRIIAEIVADSILQKHNIETPQKSILDNEQRKEISCFISDQSKNLDHILKMSVGFCDLLSDGFDTELSRVIQEAPTIDGDSVNKTTSEELDNELPESNSFGIDDFF